MDLVWRSCYRIRIYSVVNVCDVLGLWRLWMLDWWIWLRLRSLWANLKLLLVLLLLLRKLLRILLLVRLLVLVLGKLLAHDFSRLWRCLLLRCHEIVLLGLWNTILSIVLNIQAGVIGLCRVNGIHCVNNAITTSISALNRTDIGRWITLRNAIYLLLLQRSTLSLTIKRVHHDTGIDLFIWHLWVTLTRRLLWMKDFVEALRCMSSIFWLGLLLRFFGFRVDLLLLEFNSRTVHAGVETWYIIKTPRLFNYSFVVFLTAMVSLERNSSEIYKVSSWIRHFSQVLSRSTVFPSLTTKISPFE